MYTYKTEESQNSSLFYFKSHHNYTFNVQIVISFLEISPELTFYEVSIDCIDQLNPKDDSKVGITVCHIINKYLTTNPYHILIYVCDSVDCKAHLRDRKFSQWYSNYNSCDHHKLFKFKYDIELHDGVLEHYTSAAFDESQYSIEFVQRIFTDYTKELDDLKN